MALTNRNQLQMIRLSVPGWLSCHILQIAVVRMIWYDIVNLTQDLVGESI